MGPQDRQRSGSRQQQLSSMIVNTHHLFPQLLRPMQIGVVCDVGSMDGADALRFRHMLPAADIYAFEANPENYQRMAADPVLADRAIEVLPFAVSDADGGAEFFLVGADYSGRNDSRGMSSLYRRTDQFAPVAVAQVRTTRLDSFLAKRVTPARVALWIDAEGAAYEVITGIQGVLRQVQLLHVEVEAEALIGAQQQLYPKVKSLLHTMGFRELATDRDRGRLQFNVIYVRHGQPALTQAWVYTCLVRARLRHLARAALQRCCPSLLRRYQARYAKRAARLN
jgi:FkbM family methyltransferase